MALTDKQKTAVFGFEDEHKVLHLSQLNLLKRNEELMHILGKYQEELLKYTHHSSEDREIRVQMLCIQELIKISSEEDWKEVRDLIQERHQEQAAIRAKQTKITTQK